MKRKDALNAIKAAGAQGGTFPIRLYVENRISLPVAREAFEAGRRFAAFIAKRDAATKELTP